MNQSFGFLRVACASPRVKVADVEANVAEMCRMVDIAQQDQVSLLAFPELSVTGYTCGDLFGQELLLRKAEDGIRQLKAHSRGKTTVIIAGVPVRVSGRLYNCAAVIHNGSLRGIVPKIHLPNYNEFYEARWFCSGADFLGGGGCTCGPVRDDGKNCFCPGAGRTVKYAGGEVSVCPNMLFSIGDSSFAVEICEDLWTPVPPSSFHATAGAEIIVNISASNEVLMKHGYRKSLVSGQSARTVSAYVYCSAGYGESTQDLVFAGSSMICENGSVLAENERFSMDSTMVTADIDTERLRALRQKETSFRIVTPDGTDDTGYGKEYLRISAGEGTPTDFSRKFYRHTDPHPFVPSEAEERESRCREITSIQVMGLATRLAHISSRTAVIGISGGLDSTLALLVTALAFDRLGWDRKRIIGVTMPGPGTSRRTRTNAGDLMESLGVTTMEIPIGKAVAQHFSDIGQDPELQDVTYENSQARERTQILMDVANKEGGIVVGTGDLSELALGWATYNGDHMSMYAVNASIPKTLVKYLVGWAADHHFGKDRIKSGRTAGEILSDIIDTPVSPELKPADAAGDITQKTEDLVGPYELHDFFLYHFFRFGCSPAKLHFLACKAFEGRYGGDVILHWLRTFVSRFFSQQFKRSCLPDCPKVGSVSLSPRGDWRMPSDAQKSMFMRELDDLQKAGTQI